MITLLFTNPFNLIIAAFIWVFSWRILGNSDALLQHPKGYWLSGAYGFMMGCMVVTYLSQAMILSFFLEKLVRPFFYTAFRYAILPLCILFFHNILLSLIIEKGFQLYLEFYLAIAEWVLVLILYSPIQAYCGEQLYSEMDSSARRLLTSHSPPHKLAHIYRGFVVLFIMLFLPYIASFKYQLLTN